MFTGRKKIISLVALVILLTSFSVQAGNKEYTEVDAQAVKEMMVTDDVLVIFPLSPIEFDNLSIKGSVNVPMDQLETGLPKDKSQKLIFYCLGTKCVASWRAAEKAVELGYKNVYAFREGLPGWTAAGYPTVTVKKIPNVEVTRISTSTLASKLANEQVILLDVNFSDDLRKFYIYHNKRVHIPLNELHLNTSELDKNKEIIVLCLKGKRSPTAARYLVGQGFTDVVVVDGGIQKWILEGRPVKKGSS